MEKKTRRDVLQLGVGAAAGIPLTMAAGRSATAAPSHALRQEPVTIEYWHINTETFGGPAVKEIVKLFQEKNPHITVNEHYQTNAYADLLERIQTAMVGGNPPDVAQVSYSYLDYVNNNFEFVPTSDLVEEFGDDEFMSNFADNIRSLGEIGGKQIGMPYALSNIVNYYNADMFKDAGLDPDNPPTTWDEWREAAQAIYDVTGKPPIYIQLINDNWTTQALIEGNGGQVLVCGEDGATAGFDSPEAIEAIQFWADLAKDNLALIANNDQGYQAFASGNCAMYSTTIARRSGLEEQTTFDLRATKFATFGDKPAKLPAGGNCLFVFSQDDAKRQAAWEFIKFCESPEAITIWVKGTGYVPPREDVVGDPQFLGDFMEENPIQKVAVEQLPLVIPWRSFPGDNGFQVAKVLADAIEEALGGQRSVEDALTSAADEANGLLDGAMCS